MRSDQSPAYTRRAVLVAGLSAAGARRRPPRHPRCRSGCHPGGRALRPVQDGPPELFTSGDRPRRQARPRQCLGRDQGARVALLGIVPGAHPDHQRPCRDRRLQEEARGRRRRPAGLRCGALHQRPGRRHEGTRLRQADGHRVPLGRSRPRQLRYPRQARRGVRREPGYPQPRAGSPLGEDRYHRHRDQGPQPADRLLRRYRPFPPLPRGPGPRRRGLRAAGLRRPPQGRQGCHQSSRSWAKATSVPPTC